MNIESYLRQLGLSDKESEVYLASLAVGESPIMPITKKVGLPRSTTYHILEKLRDEELLEILETPTRRVYVPYPPRAILKLLKKKRDTFEQEIDSFQSSLEEINGLYNTSAFQPKVRFFRGTKEIRHIYDEILEAPINEFCYISEVKKIEKVLGKDFLKEWLKKRIAKGIKSKTVWVRSESVPDEPIYAGSRNNLRTVRYAPSDFRSPAHTMVYGDNVVVITTAEENIGLVITSRDYATSVRNQFKQLWKVSSER